MKSLLVGAVVMLSSGGIGQLAAQTSAPMPAQTSPAPAAPPAAVQPPSTVPAPATEGRGSGLTDGQIGDQVDAIIAKLKANLRLSADQNRDWPSLESTLHDFGIDQVKRQMAFSMERENRRETRRRDRSNDGNESDARPDEIDNMRRDADSLTTRADNLRRIASAAEPLFRTMNEGQKREMVQFLHRSLADRRDE